MQENTSTTTETNGDSTAFTDRIRTGLQLAQDRLNAVPERARALGELPKQVRDAIESAVDKAVDQTRGRLLASLDLPRKSELDKLLERIDELDSRLAAIEGTKKPTRKKTATKKVDKGARRDAIKASAQKGKKSTGKKSGSTKTSTKKSTTKKSR